MPAPKDVKQVRELMVGMNYYRIIFPDLSERFRPCNSLLLVLLTPPTVLEPGSGQGNRTTHTVAVNYVCVFFLLSFCSLCYEFSATHSPPLAGL